MDDELQEQIDDIKDSIENQNSEEAIKKTGELRNMIAERDVN